jgi:hypothetical protein
MSFATRLILFVALMSALWPRRSVSRNLRSERGATNRLASLTYV